MAGPRKMDAMVKADFVRTQCRKVMEREEWTGEFRARDSPGMVCSWMILWYMCSLNYFPHNFYLSLFPDFTPMLSPKPAQDFRKPSKQHDKSHKGLTFLDVQIAISELRLSSVQKKTMKIQEELVLAALTEHKRSGSVELQVSDEDAILADAKCIQFRGEHAEFLRFMERQERNQENAGDLMEPSARKVTQSTTPAPPQCSICSDKDPRDDDYLTQCSVIPMQSCKISVHGTCYGLEDKEDDWVCELCQVFGPTIGASVSCALCPVKGGALRPTVHSYDSEFAGMLTDASLHRRKRTRSRSKPDLKDLIWCHIFCASRLEKAKFLDSGIDLSEIDPARFQLKCEMCKSRNGAGVTCAHQKCGAAFHPECGKALFVYSRSEEGSYEYRIFCGQHRPLKLRQVLESRDRKFVEDVCKFVKTYERWEGRLVRGKRPQSKKRKDVHTKYALPRNFTQDEDQALEFRLFSFLKRLQRRSKEPFLISINLQANTRRGRVVISHPPFFSMVAPEVILEERITIDERTPEECYKRYSDILMNRLKNELLLNGQRVSIYSGRDPGALRLYRKKAFTRRNRSGPKPRAGVFEDITSMEKYCICNQPFVYMLSTKGAWTEQEYDQSLQDNHMIGCSECDGWFHMKCVKYPGTIEEASKDDDWICPNCEKKGKRKKVKKRDLSDCKESIIGEYDKGVCTRRQLGTGGSQVAYES